MPSQRAHTRASGRKITSRPAHDHGLVHDQAKPDSAETRAGTSDSAGTSRAAAASSTDLANPPPTALSHARGRPLRRPWSILTGQPARRDAG
ncbi:hypothetical protein [Amycolatopsis sp. WAC 01376]|uniref:hypothetical protein n=1 Tax=Amycolatopsis sp. WAC 01376 TaxID=2203195 RepID=UPI0013151ACE|nr:hypothetical protein [Amycolatopsis sp. WAC 01376]